MKTKIKNSNKPVAEDLNLKQDVIETHSNKNELNEGKNLVPLPGINNIDEMAEAFANYSYFFVLPS